MKYKIKVQQRTSTKSKLGILKDIKLVNHKKTDNEKKIKVRSTDIIHQKGDITTEPTGITKIIRKDFE